MGFLTLDGEIDVQRTRECVELARPMSVTFHRAFDVSKNLIKSLETLISIGGIKRILTSGSESSALEGLDVIQELVKVANDRVQILPGGGITPGNVKRILDKCKVKEIHMAIPKVLQSEMKYRNPRVYMGTAILTPEFQVVVSDGEVISQIVSDL